jgi:hypothetical protein
MPRLPGSLVRKKLGLALELAPDVPGVDANESASALYARPVCGDYFAGRPIVMAQ